MAFDNKLGLYLHWGIYSLTGIHEQAFARENMDRAEYEGLMNSFNPVDYDPDGIVSLAKSCGMKYICYTAKHHDGFCMFDSAYTDYKITNTPYGRDTLKMLSDACAKQDMLLSIYYSLPDWHHEHGYNPASTHQWKAKIRTDADPAVYRQYVKNQITELMTNYGKIYTLFWDIPPHIYDPSVNELVRRLQPGILINDRGYDQGDFSTPEREYEARNDGFFTRMTEACNSLGEQSWGYRANEDFYTLRHIKTSIDSIMSRGGSYIINVGPDSRGRITDEYRERVLKIGDWYNRMEGCLEGAEPDTFNYVLKGEKCIATKKNGKTYLHYTNGIRSSSLAMTLFPSYPKSARFMNSGKKLGVAMDRLPEYMTPDGRARQYLHITGIDADSYPDEPAVIEIEW